MLQFGSGYPSSFPKTLTFNSEIQNILNVTKLSARSAENSEEV